jgi:hypothetical protein
MFTLSLVCMLVHALVDSEHWSSYVAMLLHCIASELMCSWTLYILYIYIHLKRHAYTVAILALAGLCSLFSGARDIQNRAPRCT